MLVVLREHRELAQQRRSLWNRLWNWFRQAFGCSSNRSDSSKSSSSSSTAAQHHRKFSGGSQEVFKNPRPQRAQPLEAGSDSEDDDGEEGADGRTQHSDFEIEGDDDDDDEAEDDDADSVEDDGDNSSAQVRDRLQVFAGLMDTDGDDGGDSGAVEFDIRHRIHESAQDVDEGDDDIIIGELPLAPPHLSQIPFSSSASMMMP